MVLPEHLQFYRTDAVRRLTVQAKARSTASEYDLSFRERYEAERDDQFASQRRV